MIKLEAYLSDLEYETLLKALAPALQKQGGTLQKLFGSGMGASVTQGIVAAMPQAAKERYTAELLNSHAAEVQQKLEELARDAGISVRVASIHAEAL